MRVSTLRIYQQGLEAIQQQQQKISILQNQISTGQRLNNPSDDPSAASRILELEQIMALDHQYQDNIGVAINRLTFEETALDQVGTLIFRIKELTIQGSNGSLNDDGLRALSAEVEERFQELLSLANSQDENGDFLFAGYNSSSQPFIAVQSGNTTSVTYNGDQGQRSLQISESRQITVDNPGSEVFLQLPEPTNLNQTTLTANTGNGLMSAASMFDAATFVPGNYEIRFTAANTYDVYDVTNAVNVVTGAAYVSSANIDFNGIRTSITGVPATGDVFSISSPQNIFETIETLRQTISGSLNSSQRSANINRVLSDLDISFGRILDVRTSIGGRLNAIDSQQDSNEANIIATQKTLSTLRDTDIVEAISQLTLEQTTLEAAQATFASITRSSLFDFLR
ncbi:MAG: flagellar hook-associated protein 3 [Gammaproteobacteria bacterium]|nr:flagellar hook-associated protein 3 [Gammaproteobacteria bacterium]